MFNRKISINCATNYPLKKLIIFIPWFFQAKCFKFYVHFRDAYNWFIYSFCIIESFCLQTQPHWSLLPKLTIFGLSASRGTNSGCKEAKIHPGENKLFHSYFFGVSSNSFFSYPIASYMMSNKNIRGPTPHKIGKYAGKFGWHDNLYVF